MAGTLTIQGTLTDDRTPAQVVVGQTVELKLRPTDALIDTDVTDAGGDYLLQAVSPPEIAADYRVDPVALTPHFNDPGFGPTHEWDAVSSPSFVDDFTVPFVNTNPAKGAVGNQSYVENTGTEQAFFSMSDSDSGDVLTPILVSGPSGVSIVKVSNSQGRLDTNTAVTPVGVHQVKVRVDDDWSGSSAVETFTVTITAANTPPVLTNPGTKNFFNNSGVQQFQLVATDADGDPLTYNKTTGPSWGSTNVSGLVSIDTDTGTRAAWAFGWRVSDGTDTDTENHTIHINNNVPVLTDPGNQVYTKNTGIQTLQLVATDADNDTLTFTKLTGDVNITISTSGLISSDTDALAEATFAVSFQTDDSNGGTDTTAFDIIVGTPTPRPEFTLIG